MEFVVLFILEQNGKEEAVKGERVGVLPYVFEKTCFFFICFIEKYKF